MTDLSILIPARNEMFLSRTIQDILEHITADTEIIAVLDGQWADPGIQQNERVTVLYYPESIGQRAATNKAAEIATGKYVMKVDAHCAFAPGFDTVLLADMQDDWTVAPLMKNLHAFDWVCKCGARTYQGPKRCAVCGSTDVEMDVVWIAKRSPNSTAYRFDSTMHFQYWNEFKKRPEGQPPLSESMSLQGSCWMATRDKYFELGLCDEEFGSWGQQGVEVACKTWLSGGKVIINHNTWYAHMFRTNGPEFGFPYPLSGSQVSQARKRSRELFPGNGWDKAVHDFDWLIRKFSPVPDWDVNRVEKGIVYYTCNTHKPEIDQMCRDKLDAARGAIDLTCVSLNKALGYGDRTILMDGERGPLMMHRQILAGLRASPAEYVFLCESDVLYHPSHFEFTPKRHDVYYYNTNVWRWKYPENFYVWTDNLQQVSGLCAHRELLIDFYEKRIAQIERDGFNRHYEPGVKQTIYPRMKGGVYGVENWQSEFPNICIRHEANLTKSKWSPDEFRNPQYAEGWKTSDHVPGWDNT